MIGERQVPPSVCWSKLRWVYSFLQYDLQTLGYVIFKGQLLIKQVDTWAATVTNTEYVRTTKTSWDQSEYPLRYEPFQWLPGKPYLYWECSTRFPQRKCLKVKYHEIRSIFIVKKDKRGLFLWKPWEKVLILLLVYHAYLVSS